MIFTKQKFFYRVMCFCASLFFLLSAPIAAQSEVVSDVKPEQELEQEIQQESLSETVGGDDALQTRLVKDLTSFIRLNTQKNLNLRVSNSLQIFTKSVRNPQTSLLSESLYKSLAYQLRDPFITHLPEISTRLYQVADNSKLYFEMIRDLEKAWAMLNTTQMRVNDSNDWHSKVIEKNLILDAVNMWYRTTRKDFYQNWMSELRLQLRKARSGLEDVRQEYNDADYSQLNIRVLELLAENNEIAQFLDTESAYLYLRTDERSLPEEVINTASYQFSQQILCQPQEDLMQIANIYLSARYPDFFQIMASEDIRKKVWHIGELSRNISKQLLLDPENQQLQAANYFLSNTVLSTVLLMKQKRLNAFAQEQESIYIQRDIDTLLIDQHPKIKGFQEFQNAIFDLILLDSFIASERESSLKLQIFRNCIDDSQENGFLENVVKSVENGRFGGLKFPQAVAVKARFQAVSNTWNGESYTLNPIAALNQSELKSGVAVDFTASSNDIAVFNEKAKESKAEQKKVVKKAIKPIQSTLPFDSIKQVTNKEAANWLANNGFTMSTTQEILSLTENVGYSIQVLTTSSASEAARVAITSSQKNETKVYLSSVSIDGVVEKRFKILVTFRVGKANAEEFLELQNKAKELRGFLKRNSVIRKDLFQ